MTTWPRSATSGAARTALPGCRRPAACVHRAQRRPRQGRRVRPSRRHERLPARSISCSSPTPRAPAAGQPPIGVPARTGQQCADRRDAPRHRRRRVLHQRRHRRRLGRDASLEHYKIQDEPHTALPPRAAGRPPGPRQPVLLALGHARRRDRPPRGAGATRGRGRGSAPRRLVSAGRHQHTTTRSWSTTRRPAAPATSSTRA